MDVKTQGRIPNGELGLLPMENCSELSNLVNQYIAERRKRRLTEDTPYENEIKDDYQIPLQLVRFSTGEGKAVISESIRGKDIYIISDVNNYNCTYELYGYENHMGPDEHFQDIKRAISAIGGKARRITVVMPYLYEGRQHKRKHRESLDCAIALQELERMGVTTLMTFDAHDPKVESAIPLIQFQNIHPTFDIIKTIIQTEKDALDIDRSSTMVISPDTGAMDRAIYYASVMEVDVGLFYKRRDYTRVVNGRNPIVQHEYMGADVAGKDIIIVDDIISSGDSVLDIAVEVKKRKARNVYAAVTFGLFTEGAEKFKEAYDNGILTRVYSTNLTFIPPWLREAEWFREVDMSKFLAILIDKLNYDSSISSVLNPFSKIKQFLAQSEW